MIFNSVHPISFHISNRAGASAILIRQFLFRNELEQTVWSWRVEVDHLEILSSNERLYQPNDFIDDWIAIDDVDLANANFKR